MNSLRLLYYFNVIPTVANKFSIKVSALPPLEQLTCFSDRSTGFVHSLIWTLDIKVSE